MAQLEERGTWPFPMAHLSAMLGWDGLQALAYTILGEWEKSGHPPADTLQTNNRAEMMAVIYSVCATASCAT